jgi:hypothetical protein
MKQLGQTFGMEVLAAGLGGLPFSWGADDQSFQGREHLTVEQNATLDAVVTAHDPLKLRANIVAVGDFILRWQPAEYTLLMQRRATAIQAGNITLVQQWDVAMARGVVDLNTTAAQNFKAALVTAGILTQQRADTIFV